MILQYNMGKKKEKMYVVFKNVNTNVQGTTQKRYRPKTLKNISTQNAKLLSVTPLNACLIVCLGWEFAYIR